MRQAIKIPSENPAKAEIPIELTDRKTNGWHSVDGGRGREYLRRASAVVYLGRCDQDRDMFAVYVDGYIMIFKGKLNSGKY